MILDRREKRVGTLAKQVNELCRMTILKTRRELKSVVAYQDKKGDKSVVAYHLSRLEK
jgi:hypothetical protein